MPARRTFDQVRAALVGLPDACWYLPSGMGGVDRSTGYCKVTVSGERWLAHRLSYTLLVGKIPGGLTIDHQCHNRDLSCIAGTSCRHRQCVNPAHLEVVPLGVNSLRGRSAPAENARKDMCDAGHPFIILPNGRRQCVECRRQLRQAYGEISAKGRKVDRTHCPQGHPYSPENTYYAKGPSGTCRQCRTCSTDRARARRKRRMGG